MDKKTLGLSEEEFNKQVDALEKKLIEQVIDSHGLITVAATSTVLTLTLICLNEKHPEFVTRDFVDNTLGVIRVAFEIGIKED